MTQASIFAIRRALACGEAYTSTREHLAASKRGLARSMVSAARSCAAAASSSAGGPLGIAARAPLAADAMSRDAAACALASSCSAASRPACRRAKHLAYQSIVVQIYEGAHNRRTHV